jgi:hypothetical protein
MSDFTWSAGARGATANGIAPGIGATMTIGRV